jgi:serine/threonine-protein phosphatase PGAM5
VRHGHYDVDDPRDESVGRGLTPIGVAQARLLGARLRALPFRFDEIVASPFTRARETAAVVADDLGLPVRILPDLAECTPPTRRRDIMEQEKPEDLAACTAQLERLAKVLLAPSAGDRRELVVCHGNVTRWLVTRALGVDVDAWLAMSVSHASVTVLVVQPDGATRVVAVGDAGHLPPNLRSGSILDADHDLRVPAGAAAARAERRPAN